MTVWDDLVGQDAVVALLQRAVAGDAHAMSHAWLITGPPGSGRSNAARAFAAALQCVSGGCGECSACRTSLAGAHPDVTLVRTEQLSIGVDEVRELVRRAAMSPTLGRHQVIVVEDAETGEQLVVDSSDAEFRRRLREAGEGREAELRGLTLRAGVDIHEVSTADDLVQALVRIIESRKRRRRR